MKRFFGFALMAVLISLPAFAAKNSQTVSLKQDVTVGTTKLAAGDYKVSWTGEGANVQVTIAQKGGATVTVPAKVVEANNNHSGVITNTSNGANVLQTILLNKINLVLGGASAQGE